MNDNVEIGPGVALRLRDDKRQEWFRGFRAVSEPYEAESGETVVRIAWAADWAAAQLDGQPARTEVMSIDRVQVDAEAKYVRNPPPEYIAEIAVERHHSEPQGPWWKRWLRR